MTRNHNNLLLRAIVLPMLGLFSPPSHVHSQETSKHTDWKPLAPHVEVIRDGSYVTQRGAHILFTAVRFHLGYTRMHFLDTQSAVDAGRDVKNGVARVVVEGHERVELLNYSLEGILATLKSKPIVMTPAGWSRSQRFVEHVGLLQIGGNRIHDVSDRSSMSAILCLHDAERFTDYDAMVPVLFHVDDSDKLNPRVSKCPDAVQVGPRIIEEDGKPGVGESELRTPKYQRVIFAVDDPGRNTPLRKSRDAARNGYLLVTHNALNLYSLQEMLLDRHFYGGGKPHWAVNLAGSNLSGMVLFENDKPELIDNTLAVVGSVLVVDQRE